MSRPRIASRAARAFTLIEMLVVAVMVAVIAGLAFDFAGGGTYERMDAAVRFIDADLALARGRALATPADPVIFRPAADGRGYWIACASAPDAPIEGPNGPVAVRFGEGRAAAAAGVRIRWRGSIRDARFGPFGGVMDPLPSFDLVVDDAPERANLTFDPLDGDHTVVYRPL
jgi:prepilin-type N-terminal cleavage/methylation domain-containing protein